MVEVAVQRGFASGWFFKIKLADPAATASLMDQAAYDALVKAA